MTADVKPRMWLPAEPPRTCDNPWCGRELGILDWAVIGGCCWCHAGVDEVLL